LSVETFSLDDAIHTTAVEIKDALDQDVKVALLNFTAPTNRFSNYVIEELSVDLVRGKKLLIVERKELDLIRKEQNFQLSGEVSDESAQAIGKLLGAQAVMSGELVSMGGTYRFRVKIINTESGGIEVAYSVAISAQDQQLAYLLSNADAEKSEREQAERKAVEKAKAEALVRADTERPIPRGLRGSSIDDWSIALEWNKTGNATSYNVYQSDKIVANVQTTTFTEKNLTPDTSYTYRIGA
jgi:TolB-like protein